MIQHEKSRFVMVSMDYSQKNPMIYLRRMTWKLDLPDNELTFG